MHKRVRGFYGNTLRSTFFLAVNGYQGVAHIGVFCPFVYSKILPLQASACEIEKITLPQIVSIKQASEIMNLPPYYLRRVCRENPDLAFQSGVKWYINLGKLAAYYNNKTEQSE